jgi:peptide/nickel transport system permease protein
MGTDELGRDQLVRVLDGGRVSLSVALAAVTVAISVGVAIGAVAGFAGGLVDNLLMRIVDIFYSIPGLFVLILLVTLLGPGFWTIVIALGVLRWMGTARLVRASFLSLREKEFVEAARAIGARQGSIVVKHILPNALSPIIVSATLGIAGAILTESALSFLGLGFQPPQATWGRMLEEAQRAVINDGHWWRGFFPGLMIFITVLSVNYIGDGLRDAVDPRRVER